MQARNGQKQKKKWLSSLQMLNQTLQLQRRMLAEVDEHMAVIERTLSGLDWQLGDKPTITPH